MEDGDETLKLEHLLSATGAPFALAKAALDVCGGNLEVDVP